MKTTATTMMAVIALSITTATASAATSHWEVRTDNIVPNTVANALLADGEGDDWTGAALLIELTAGSTYQHVIGDNNAPSSAFIGFVPELEFDTYVGIIDDSSHGVGGALGDLYPYPIGLDGPVIFFSWFNTRTSDTGPVQIANITLSPDTTGTWELVTSFAGGQVQTGGTVINGTIVPEPASLTMLVLGSLAMIRQR